MNKGDLSSPQGDWFKMAPLGADTTPYAAKGFNVEPQFRAMMHAEGVPEELRLKLVEMKFDTTTEFALLGKDLTAFEEKIEKLLTTQ